MSEENLFEGVLVLSIVLWDSNQDLQNQIARICQVNQKLEISGCGCGEVRDIYSLNERIPSARECVCTYVHMYFLDGRPKTYPGRQIEDLACHGHGQRQRLLSGRGRESFLLWDMGYRIQDI